MKNDFNHMVQICEKHPNSKKILKNYLKAPVKEFDKDKLYNPLLYPGKGKLLNRKERYKLYKTMLENQRKYKKFKQLRAKRIKKNRIQCNVYNSGIIGIISPFDK